MFQVSEPWNVIFQALNLFPCVKILKFIFNCTEKIPFGLFPTYYVFKKLSILYMASILLMHSFSPIAYTLLIVW